MICSSLQRTCGQCKQVHVKLDFQVPTFQILHSMKAVVMWMSSFYSLHNIVIWCFWLHKCTSLITFGHVICSNVLQCQPILFKLIARRKLYRHYSIQVTQICALLTLFFITLHSSTTMIHLSRGHYLFPTFQITMDSYMFETSQL